MLKLSNKLIFFQRLLFMRIKWYKKCWKKIHWIIKKENTRKKCNKNHKILQNHTKPTKCPRKRIYFCTKFFILFLLCAKMLFFLFFFQVYGKKWSSYEISAFKFNCKNASMVKSQCNDYCVKFIVFCSKSK